MIGRAIVFTLVIGIWFGLWIGFEDSNQLERETREFVELIAGVLFGSGCVIIGMFGAMLFDGEIRRLWNRA